MIMPFLSDSLANAGCQVMEGGPFNITFLMDELPDSTPGQDPNPEGSVLRHRQGKIGPGDFWVGICPEDDQQLYSGQAARFFSLGRSSELRPFASPPDSPGRGLFPRKIVPGSPRLYRVSQK